MNEKFFYSLIFVIVALSACKERYFPQYETTNKGYLVVEGILNAGNEPTNLSITRTYPIEAAGKRVEETNAQVSVEGSDNSTQTLAMTAPGTYNHSNLSLAQNIDYRLRIKTTDGKEYLSEFVRVKVTPPIDSIGYKRNTDGVQIYVNSKDPANNTIYYRWDFDETWEINSFWSSVLIYDPTSNPPVRDRIFPDEQIERCWRNDISKNLLFASSAKLSSDIIHEKPLQFIPNGDEKLAVLYSMMLRQYSMDKKAYEFFDLMKKNTESLGTVFDPQPSEIRGNIKCLSNPDEIVIGYVSATTVQRKRVFFKRPVNWTFLQNCPTHLVTPDSVAFYFGSNSLIPIYGVPREGSPVVDYLSAAPPCVDCQMRGGRRSKPSFWPN